jgi:hypothetical protein
MGAMSEERPSIAEAMYGKDGPIGGGPSDPRTREIIDGGIARPDPRFVNDRPSSSRPPLPGAVPVRPGMPTLSPRSDPGGQPFDAARIEGRDPGSMTEFQTAARELNLDQRGGQQLLDAIKKDEDAQVARYADGAAALERSLDPEHLAYVRELIDDPHLTPKPIREWLGRWGSHPQIAETLVNWIAYIRNGRGRY